MKKYNDTIIKLSQQTGFSNRKCSKELKNHNYDYDATLEHLKQLRLDPIEIYSDSVSSLFLSERGKIIKISDCEGNDIVSISWIIPVLSLYLIDIPSWVIASLVILMILFNLNFHIESKVKRDIIKDTTIDIDSYMRTKQPANEITADDNGYYEITIK